MWLVVISAVKKLLVNTLGISPKSTRLSVGKSVRHRTVMLVGVPSWRYGPRNTVVGENVSRRTSSNQLVPITFGSPDVIWTLSFSAPSGTTITPVTDSHFNCTPEAE